MNSKTKNALRHAKSIERERELALATLNFIDAIARSERPTALSNPRSVDVRRAAINLTSRALAELTFTDGDGISKIDSDTLASARETLPDTVAADDIGRRDALSVALALEFYDLIEILI